MNNQNFQNFVLERYGMPIERLSPEAIEQIRRYKKADKFISSISPKGRFVDRDYKFNKPNRA